MQLPACNSTDLGKLRQEHQLSLQVQHNETLTQKKKVVGQLLVIEWMISTNISYFFLSNFKAEVFRIILHWQWYSQGIRLRKVKSMFPWLGKSHS